MKVFIDAGHNYTGSDTGAQGHGLREQDITFSIADKLKALLITCGHEVKMSREKVTDSLGISLSDSLHTRAGLANQWGAQLFVSIHCNAFDGKAHGTETLVYSLNGQAAEYAEKIQKAIVGQLGTADRGVKQRQDLVVLRKTAMPAVLVETAFIDNKADSLLLKNNAEDFAKAICEGITGKTVQKEETAMAQTVMKLDNVYVQEIFPADFKILQCDCKKNNVNAGNYFNLGFFTALADGTTYPVGNLAIDGNIISQAKNSPDWINLSGKKLSTVYTTKSGECGLIQTDELRTIEGLKMAVSGIPIIVGGKQVKLDRIKAEGYFGDELYDTWHGFLGLRHGKLVYVATKCDFGQMCWVLVALGIYDAIKLDGGGSFILHNGKTIAATNENRRIHNVGTWTL